MYSEKGQQTKDHFIRVSANLFNTKGYAGTSISDILSAAGYSKGALYRVFKDKDELAVAAFSYNFKLMKTQLKNAYESATNDIDRIFAVPRFYKNIRENNFIKGGCPILNTSIEADDTHPILKKLSSNAFIRMRELIEMAITTAQTNGSIGDHIHPRELSQYMVATIEGSIAMTQSLEDPKIIKCNMEYLENNIKSML